MVMQSGDLQFFSDTLMKLLFTEGPIAHFSLRFLFDLHPALPADLRSSLATEVQVFITKHPSFSRDRMLSILLDDHFVFLFFLDNACISPSHISLKSIPAFELIRYRNFDSVFLCVNWFYLIVILIHTCSIIVTMGTKQALQLCKQK